MDTTIIEAPIRAKNDPAWKEVIETFFPDFIHFCMPALAQLIDWNIPWQTLDAELHAVTKDAEVGTRFVDKLFKVFLKNGAEQWVLVHIEIQGDYYKPFAKRTFDSVCRLHQQYGQPVVSCAILTDENQNWRPNYYEVAFAGTCLSLEFTVIKLIDYWSRIDELEKSSNPFASVILIQLAALEAKGKPGKERFNFKMTLTRRLYEKGFSKEHIIKLYYFIDWLILLPKQHEVEYLNNVYELEVKKTMAYVSNAEWFGIEKGYKKGRLEGLHEGKLEGKQEGRQEGEAAVLIRQLTRKFGQITSNYRERIMQADAEILLIWSEQILDAKTIEEVFN